MATSELKDRLEDAEKAYRDAISGRGIRTLVDQSGERIEYSPANLTKLSAYIADLKRQLGLIDRPVGPMGFFF